MSCGWGVVVVVDGRGVISGQGPPGSQDCQAHPLWPSLIPLAWHAQSFPPLYLVMPGLVFSITQ